MPHQTRLISLSVLAFCAALFPLASANASPIQDTNTAAAVSLSPVTASSSAQKLYAAAKNDLLQIKVLVKTGRTQSSVGSGFMIDQSDLVVTNYHVIAQIALEPDIYVGEFVDTNNQRGSVELLAVDVIHDLAVVRVTRHGTGFFHVPDQTSQLVALNQGQYLYSMGNPLDLGFAISEGSYNGVIGRAFYDQLLFTGSINAGMSGGPNLTANGELAGVNVSKRTDGELVSFLVPARFVVDLLNQVKTQKNPSKNFSEDIGRQLIAHQDTMINTLLESPFSLKRLGDYQVPVRESEQMRCWGSSGDKENSRYTENELNCRMESALYVSEKLQKTGHLAISHSFTQSKNLDAIRFSRLLSQRFKNKIYFGTALQGMSSPVCTEDFIKNATMSLRAVMCVRAYRKFAGLYDFTVLTASLDRGEEVLQSRLDTHGVSYENGIRVSKLFLNALARNKAAGVKK